jgi:tetratricopeptide (TPR) repeat protein/predicted Ser/Thr protein kinase
VATVGFDDVTRTRTETSDDGPRDPDADQRTRVPGVANVPSVIGRYRVTGYIGRGGMGMVLSAQDTELKRAVALKLLHPGALGDKARTRIEREAQAMAKLSHPNVVTVYEVGRAGEQPFIAMELVGGVTLREWLRAEKRAWRKTLEMVISAGRGLAAAHSAGLVHRDFKPENVLVGADERPRVTDFGLVASTTAEREAVEAGEGYSVMGGTPPYMPPEQWTGGEIDARADQFAFAVTCWEALWGQRPFPAKDMIATEKQGPKGEPARIRSRRGVPRRVEAALRRALQADREARWPELNELLDRLQRVVRDRRATIAGIALVPVAAVAVFAFRAGAGTAESPCRDADTGLGDLWSPAQQRALAGAFAARPESYARDAWADVQRTIDAWVADYRGLRTQTCETRRSRAPGGVPIAIARDRCLDRRRDELSALLGALAKPDTTTVQYARAAAHGLARPISCVTGQSDGSATAEPPLASRDALGSLRARLTDASTKRLLGKPIEAVAIAEPAAKEAQTLGWTPLIAVSQLELARSLQAANRNEEGERAHARAALEADAAQDDETRFEAMIGLAVAGMDHSRYDEAGRAIESARMIARRLPSDDRRLVVLEIQESTLAFWRGEYDTCVTRGKATMARIATVLGANAIEGASLMNKVAHCQFKMAQGEDAEASMKEALRIAETAVGREHPITADIVFALGYAAAAQNRIDEALAYFREALAIRERVLGADNAVVGVSHTGVGDLLAYMGRFDEAKESYQRAIEILVPAWGADSPAVAIAEKGLGAVSFDSRAYADAERHFGNALAILRVKRPPGHDETTYSVMMVGRSMLAQGKRDSIGVLQEAVTAYDAMSGVRPSSAALARFHLGLAQLQFGDRARGLALVKAGCAQIEAAPDLASDARRCRDYIDELAARKIQ